MANNFCENEAMGFRDRVYSRIPLVTIRLAIVRCRVSGQLTNLEKNKATFKSIKLKQKQSLDRIRRPGCNRTNVIVRKKRPGFSSKSPGIEQKRALRQP